ncbi:RICIN domain-containing protein [Alkalihalobacillus hemicellulosilyticus]|uniref:RTX toxins and related Ca2+-binding proteins n=1 Tax=Halalkalibacter hemicellulosilyticusJCM 9152 TaxID=1236971 RepID=W4QKW9_9BACI|nr:RICIN domain-containing protein [Halalkalibacter hemicellulosilyticus]GAE31969.1 RTX toxins and related Ca2+-binding proteins [Halalkalibacter hemicellulosilyticusJCM 9152]
MISKQAQLVRRVLLSSLLFSCFFMILAQEDSYAEEVVNARDFGMTPGVETSQTEALHAAMRYFYDRGVEGTVYIPAGTYAVDEAVRFHQGVNLIGEGMGETVLKKAGTRNNYVVGNPIMRSGNQLNVTVSHLTIDGDRENRANQGLGQIGGMNIDADVSHLTIENVEVRDVTIGLLLRRLKNSTIRDSIIDRSSGHGIAFGSESHAVGDVHSNLITHNKITNSIGGSGINLSRATYTTVTYNQVINDVQQGDSYGGIRIPNDGAYNTVEHNVIENYPRGIFVLSGAHHNTIASNTVINSHIHGVLIQSDHNILSDNVIQQLDPSLNIESVIRLAPGSQNQIVGNKIETFSSFSNPGIRLTGSSNQNTISGNTIDTSGTAVSIEGGSGNTNTNNTRVTNPVQFDAQVSYELVNRNSGKLLEVVNAGTNPGDNVQQWERNFHPCQRWIIIQNSEGYYEIINRNSNQALEVFDWSSSNGGNVVQWTHLGGYNQQWTIERTSDGYYTLVNRYSGKALDAYNRSLLNGGNIVQWDLNNDFNQQWNIIKVD